MSTNIRDMWWHNNDIGNDRNLYSTLRASRSWEILTVEVGGMCLGINAATVVVPALMENC